MLLPCVPLCDQLRSLTPELERLATALALPAAGQRRWLEAPNAPWRLLVRLVAIVPASAAHHDCGSGGLARYLLRVAQGAAQRQRAAQAALDASGAHVATPAAARTAGDAQQEVEDAVQQEARERLVLALAASLRAVGVVWRQEVQARPGGEAWPRLRYLSDWALEQQATQLSVVWTPGVSGGADGHGALGAAVLALVLPAGAASVLGRAGLSRLLTLVLAGAPPSADADLALLSAAAAQARADGVVGGDPRTRRSAPAQPILTLADAVRSALRERLTQPGATFSTVAAPALCSATHTILFLANDPSRSLLPDLAGLLRRDGHALPGTAPGCTWRFMLWVARELATQQLPDETPWCVVADGDASDPGDRVLHLVQVTDAQRGVTRRSPALILRNRALGEDWSPPAPPLAEVPVLVRCCRDHRGLDSVDAQDLGMSAGPALPGGFATPCRPRELTVASRCLASADTIRDLPAVVRDLVAVTSTLCRIHRPGPTPVHWRHLLSALPEPLPVALISDVLEAVVDQLHDLSHHPAAARMSPPDPVTPAAS